MIKSGVSLKKMEATRCWSHGGDKHIIRAQEFAEALSTAGIGGVGQKENIRPSDFQTKLSGRTGIIYFGDYWRRGGESFENRSGDHIDLWNKDRLTGQTMFWRDVAEFFVFVTGASDLNDSKRIWFWKVR